MKTSLLLFSIFLSILIYANINNMHGRIGMTLRDGGFGCQCHSEFSNDSVSVWIEGPDTVYLNDTASYKLFMSGGPAVTGGFDLAAYFGVLDSTDTLTHIFYEELTHRTPKYFVNDTVFWNFDYVAPDSLITDTLYATANSTNNDSIPTELDQWNHSDNYIINVVSEPVLVQNNDLLLNNFFLSQNFPNPFNPSTKIKFTIPFVSLSGVEGSIVTLKIFDLLGKEIATLLNEEKSAGEYEIEFNASELTSGVYLYKLQMGKLAATKKMILLK
jgi:hypothetical protein